MKYNKIVTALVTDDMQQKLLMYVHLSFDQSTSSSTTLTVFDRRPSTRKKVNENVKIKSRSNLSLDMVRTSSVENMENLITFAKIVV